MPKKLMANQINNVKDHKQYILIEGARQHNLKNIHVAIPRNKLVVITGLSGSGKSSLAFDTLYAEGQRRYVESLSSYARQFVGRMNKPDVDNIRGISPAIAIEQKVNSRNPRSTVGTSTEIYDYLKLLFARVGITYSPISGKQVKRHSISDVVDFILNKDNGTKVFLYSPVIFHKERSLEDELAVIIQKGFSRIRYNNEIQRAEDLLDSLSEKEKKKSNVKGLEILADRFIVDKEDDELGSRIADSVQTCFFESKGDCTVELIAEDETSTSSSFSNRFEMDGISFEEPSTHLFSFNNPYGACKTCEGFGTIIGIDEDLVIPNKSLSIYDGAVACWRGEKMKEWNDALVMKAYEFEFPIHKPYYMLSIEQKKLIWSGNKYFKGLNEFFKYLEEQSYKIQYRVMLSRYRGRTGCPDCNGSRLRQDANFVKFGSKSITEIVLMPVAESLEFFQTFKADARIQKIASRLLIEITNRLQFLFDVGLGYLTLNRLSNSLSGGESQRINLATSLGSSLVGSMYILDEPSIGLHPRDTQRLIKVLQSLRRLGNTVIVVEHDEEIMQAAEHLIDIGPLAGAHGGELIFEGNYEQILTDEISLTGKYLSGKMGIDIPVKRRVTKNYIEIQGARENNLNGINVRFPLDCMTVVTGVSGSGKTSLVKRVLYPALKKLFGGYSEESGLYDHITGDLDKVSSVELVDQNPIGKSSRSNPATYVKAYDEIRELYAEQGLSKTRKFKASHFSFNVDGGRCPVCQGEGQVTIEMQFMADIHLTCETCSGKRFTDEVLEVKFKENNIYNILDLTIEEAIEFFSEESNFDNITRKIVEKLKPLFDVGLGYVKLGQSSNTLSGGEAQRIKLASFLSKGNIHDHTIFFFDEPTTGLHFHDIRKLLDSFNALIAQGNSVIIIEHNLEIIKCADWVIDLGPEGGSTGGNIVYSGLPEGLAECEESHTGKFLKEKLLKDKS